MFDSLFPKEWTTLQRLMWLKTNALARAVYETISGNPVSFTAKAAPLKQLKVAFSPKQDLHGYDAPWPAGGGKNKFNIDAIPDRPLDSSGSYITNNGNGTVTVHYGIGSSAIATGKKLSEIADLVVGETYRFSAKTSEGANKYIYLSAPYSNTWNFGTYKTITQDMLDGKVFLYAYNTQDSTAVLSEMQMELGTAATSYAPYSNLCPILGWDSLNVEQTGVNVWDEEWEVGAFNHNTGAPTSSSNTIRSKNAIPVMPQTTYRFVSTGAIYGFFYDAERQFIKHQYYSVSGGGANVTTPENARFFNFYCYGTTYENNKSINYPATDTAYHAYNPSSRSISITLGSTVYSGILDVVTGVVTVDRFYGHLTEMPHNWGFSTVGDVVTVGYYQYVHYNGELMNWPAVAASPGLMCNTLPIINVIPGYQNPMGITFNVSGFYIALRLPIDLLGIDETATAAQRKAAMDTWLANNQTYVCCKMATPQTIQLTPQEVESLAGDNNLWSDANGDLTVTYRSN